MEIYKYKYLTSAAVAVGCVCVAYHVTRRKSKIREAHDAFVYLQIEIIETEKACDELVQELRRRCKGHNALGFDCEWVTEKGKRRPVALVQLSSYDGLCGLFRLNCIKTVPNSLKELLEDESIYKVGVAAIDDAKYLLADYAVCLRSTLDVRHIAKLCGQEAGGLAALARSQLGVVLDKSWRIRCSDWEAEKLSEKQTKYAAADAHVAIKIFATLFDKYSHRSLVSWLASWLNSAGTAQRVEQMARRYADVNYKPSVREKKKKDVVKPGRVKNNTGLAQRLYPNAVRSKPLYHNCYMYAPDGELLCTCDDKKASWYLARNLAVVESTSPLRIRLRFEPSARCVGEVGRYYQQTKCNRCVVCGQDSSFIRKNVVPREYRKYFPEIMKDHSSHDVVLLCASCHCTSNMRDQAVRSRLAHQCAAPLPGADNVKHTEDPAIKKIRSAARALLYQSQVHVLPESRRRQLEELLLQHYPQHHAITQELLQHASNVQTLVENEAYESHGLKVIEYYKKMEGGLLRLEEMWREHFLNSMNPKYMPELWSVKHNEERLRIKYDEGRLTDEELEMIGVCWKKN